MLEFEKYIFTPKNIFLMRIATIIVSVARENKKFSRLIFSEVLVHLLSNFQE